jgi:histidine ammonia-lyase
VAGLARVLAIELVCAGRGLDLRAPLRPGPGTLAALACLRDVVGGPGPDRFVAPDLEAAAALVSSGELVAAVEGAVGELA